MKTKEKSKVKCPAHFVLRSEEVASKCDWVINIGPSPNYFPSFLRYCLCQSYVASPLIESVSRELKQQRRQRQRKRHLKTNIWEMVTILLLLLLRRIPYF